MQYRRLAAHRMKQRATRRAACLATCRSRSQNALVTDRQRLRYRCNPTRSREATYTTDRRQLPRSALSHSPERNLLTTSRLTFWRRHRSAVRAFPVLDFCHSARTASHPNRSETAATQADFFLWAASASVNQSSSSKYCLARSWNFRSRELPCSSNASCTLGTGRMAGIGTPPR
jgi:hypothetical protein